MKCMVLKLSHLKIVGLLFIISLFFPLMGCSTTGVLAGLATAEMIVRSPATKVVTEKITNYLQKNKPEDDQ